MLGNMQTVTLYHKGYDEQTRLDTWTRAVFTTARVFARDGAAITNKGLDTACSCIARIFTSDVVAVKPDDVLVVGICDSLTPPDRRSAEQTPYTVLTVTDNRRGGPSVRHWRLDCK